MSNVPAVEIDDASKFKYILIDATAKKDKSTSKLVRGTAKHQYHNEIFDAVQSKIGDQYELKVLGGGKIERDNEARTIKIYGESTAYGPADHNVAIELVQSALPDYKITTQ